MMISQVQNNPFFPLVGSGLMFPPVVKNLAVKSQFTLQVIP